MEKFMLEVPEFDANMAQYTLRLLDSLSIPAGEVLPFLTLHLALERIANPQKENDTDE